MRLNHREHRDAREGSKFFELKANLCSPISRNLLDEKKLQPRRRENAKVDAKKSKTKSFASRLTSRCRAFAVPLITVAAELRWVLCGSILFFAVGCAPHITPPMVPKNAVTVFVADYGRHSSLLLPDEKGGLVEFAWGDYQWFAENHTGNADGLAALFWSGGSTLGRRQLPTLLPHDELMHSLSATRLLSFVADADKAAAVREELTERFNRHGDTIIYNESSHVYFVRDDEHYWFAHNCNHLTADWLRELGCRVDGWVLYSNFEISTVQ